MGGREMFGMEKRMDGAGKRKTDRIFWIQSVFVFYSVSPSRISLAMAARAPTFCSAVSPALPCR